VQLVVLHLAVLVVLDDQLQLAAHLLHTLLAVRVEIKEVV
jgi:hypothetical protein